jgi:hypothetical protein
MINRPAYPANWEVLARQCKERANFTCEHCGVKQHQIVTSHKGTPYFIYLHAAHKHHDRHNPTPELMCLCISCHARYDYQRKQREARIRLEMIKHLRLLVEQGIVEVKYFI